MSETIYTVKSGDSLSVIANKFNVSGGYMTLAKYNGISNPNIISVGQKIRIPGTTSASSTPQQSTQSSGGSVTVGSKVKITGTKYSTGQAIPNWVRQNTYTVSQISGQKALIKEIVSWVNLNDLQVVGNGGGSSNGGSNSGGGSSAQPQQQQQPQQGTKDGGSGASSLATSSVNFGQKNSNARTSKVSKITIHHMAGNMGAQACANMHKNGQASANYYVGSAGEICAGVAENRRAWTSSNGTNDQQAITMEVANNSGAPDWTISQAAYNSMIALCRDLCNRYGITPHFDGTPSGSLTAHYMFASTACPGPYIKARLKNGQIENDIKGNGGDQKKQDEKKQDEKKQNNTNTGSTSVQTYTVKAGDSLSKIASMFNVPGGYQALAQYNGISNPNVISVGQVIKIPSGSTQATTTTPVVQPTTGGGSATGNGSTGSTAGAVYGKSHAPMMTQNIRPIYEYLMNNVLAGRKNAKAFACGFLGNMYTESHYDPGAEQAYGKSTLAKGLVQWDGGRRDNMLAYCGAKSVSERDKWAVLSKQLDFLKDEINGAEKWSMTPTFNGKYNNGTYVGVPENTAAGARLAAKLIAHNFERCAAPDNPERQNKAEENFKSLT